MPKVQSYRQQVSSGQPIADTTTDVRATPEHFGAGVARGVTSLAGNLAKMQAEDDANAATEVFNQASEEARKHLYDGEAAVYSQQGKGATGAHDSSKSFFEEIHNKYSANLSNDNQRKAFNAMWGRRTNTNLDNIARHEATERKKYFAETQDASLQGAAAHAANNFNKPDEVQNALTEVDTIIRANTTGSSEEAVLQKQTIARSAIHKSVLDRMMINDPDGARDYYEANQKQIEGQHHEQIEKSLKGNKQKKESQAAADLIIADTTTSDADKRAKAKEIENPDVRALTEGLVSQDIARRKTDRIENERQLNEGFWNEFIQNPDINDIPENLPAATKLAAIKFASSGGKVKTNLKKWNDINQIAINEPEKFAEMDLFKHVNDLDESDFQAFGKLQRTIKNADKQTLTHVQGINSKATKALKAIGKKVESDTGQLFMRKFQDEVSTLERENKRKIRPDEVDVVIDRLLLQGEVEDGASILGINLNDPDKFLFEVEPGERFLIDNVYVPDNDRENIIKAYKNKRGIAPSEEQILNLYKIKARK